MLKPADLSPPRRSCRFLTAALLAAPIVGQPAIVPAGPRDEDFSVIQRRHDPVAYNAYLLRALSGDADAQLQLAIMLIDGSAGRTDRKAAAAWLGRAADIDHVNAQYLLGALLNAGVDGKRDATGAAPWFERAARSGHPDAAFNLAVLLETGDGVPQDSARALTLYRQAAEGGVVEAKHGLGSMLAFGRGVPRDVIEGGMWLELALQSGDDNVQGELETLRRELTPSQRAEVQSRVDAHVRSVPPH